MLWTNVSIKKYSFRLVLLSDTVWTLSYTPCVHMCVCGGVCASHFINCVVWINLRAIWYLIFWKISCIAVFLLCACGGVSGLMLAFHYNELV